MTVTPTRLHPSLRLDTGLYRELDVLQRLEDSLPTGYELFHSVNWHTVHQGTDCHGEIDIVVLAPSGNILLIEVKAGDVFLRGGQILKLYEGRERDVGKQSQIQYAAMRNRLNQAKLDTRVVNCLVLPDYQVGDAPIVAYPRERIIDASQFDMLGTLARGMIPSMPARSGFEAVRLFLANEFKVSPDLRVLGHQLRTAKRHLADGLATWVPRIESPAGVIQVQATAGSGKTQLALRLLEGTATAGGHALYVCFNRMLADHVGRIAPTRAKVTSFHELSVDHYRRAVGEPAFSEDGIFDVMASRFCADVEAMESRFDLIIIDESQDFAPDWVQALMGLLAESARLYVLGDEDQRLYGRESFGINDAVTIRCGDNFRSPRAIVQTINAFALTLHAVEALSPYAGEPPGMRIYEDHRDLLYQTAQAIDALRARGIDLSEIAVLSWQGHAKSALLSAARIGDYALSRFSGRYTAAGEQEWAAGDLIAESVYRFKGQSAAGIVLTEVDFEELGELERRKLFVGLTRGELAVEMVLSKAAEECLVEVLR